MSQNNTRVVVTGLGATTPVGGTAESTWSALLAGQSGVHTIKDDWAADLPVNFAGVAAVDPAEVLDRVEARKLDRIAQFALVAAREAWADAGLDTVDPLRLGVSVATGIGGALTLLSSWDAMKTGGPRKVSPHTIPMLMPNSAAATVGIEFTARAGVHTPVAACASGAESMAQGLEMIRSGRADVVVVGGTEACVHPLPLAAFASMMALSRRNDNPEAASRPWDKARDGFVFAEGCAILVLESFEHAQARGARMYAEVAGSGITSDGSDSMVQPDPTGAGAQRAIEAALADAGASASDVVHVNAHATSTPQGDVAEALAIRHALGAASDGACVTSTKSMTGHLLGAAGALESLAVVKSIYERLAPPTINLDDPEDDLGLDIVTGSPRALRAGDIVALNNSFGFGGHNVALAFRSI